MGLIKGSQQVIDEQCDENDNANVRARKEKMIRAMSLALGNVTTACEVAGISRNTHYRWLGEDEWYKKSINIVVDEERIDFYESKLNELANGIIMHSPMGGGESVYICKLEDGVYVPIMEKPVQIYKRAPCVKAITTALECLGKARGWVKRVEQTGAGGTPLNNQIVYVDQAEKKATDAHIDEVVDGDSE